MRIISLIILTFLYANAYAQQEGKTFAIAKPEVIGVWKSIGDGYLLKVDDKAITWVMLIRQYVKYHGKKQNN